MCPQPALSWKTRLPPLTNSFIVENVAIDHGTPWVQHVTTSERSLLPTSASNPLLQETTSCDYNKLIFIAISFLHNEPTQPGHHLTRPQSAWRWAGSNLGQQGHRRRKRPKRLIAIPAIGGMKHKPHCLKIGIPKSQASTCKMLKLRLVLKKRGFWWASNIALKKNCCKKIAYPPLPVKAGGCSWKLHEALHHLSVSGAKLCSATC